MTISFAPAPAPEPRRIREIEDAFGTCLRLWVEPHPAGGVIAMERADLPGCPRVRLDVFGAEMLSAMILSARMTNTGTTIPEETVDGQFPARFDLIQHPQPAVRLSCGVGTEHAGFDLPALLWDRMFVELTLAATVARELARRPWTLH
ncbi:hypothetical protein [Sphingomonas sp. GC_Shp_3]|uniref:hypothetical protein n=1 Tax=Sphingomonas sp. GC_Shp_3 TaxID=2937383 RepID=UPI002269FC0B|nr:hypothetical protein [Sphingomonas sp. GC_Shp_3]